MSASNDPQEFVIEIDSKDTFDSENAFRDIIEIDDESLDFKSSDNKEESIPCIPFDMVMSMVNELDQKRKFEQLDKSTFSESKSDTKNDEADIPKLLPEAQGYSLEMFDPTPSHNFICGICTEIVRDPPNLPCPHLFCRQCLKMSSEKKTNCPICRTFFGGSVDSLASSSFVVQTIINMPIKCPRFKHGCKWTGIIGDGEQRIIDHLKNQCIWGGWIRCNKCDQKIFNAEMEEHKLQCSDEEVKCEYCDFFGLRKYIFVHKIIGQFCKRICNNKDRCVIEDCKALINYENRFDHLEKECEHFPRICYGCETQHYLPAYKLMDHVKEFTNNPTWSNRWISRTSTRTVNVGDLRYIGERDIIWLEDPNRPTRSSGFICSIEEVSKSGIKSSIIPGGYIRSLDTYTSPPLLNISHDRFTVIITDQALDHLNYHECSFGSSKKGYFIQPFFKCRTCSNSKNSFGGNIGCCAVCAIDCHWGHDIYLDNQSGTNYCDCGAGDLKPKGGKGCRAASCLNIPASFTNSSDDTALVKVNFKVRGNLDLQVEINLFNEISKNQTNDDDDYDSDFEDEFVEL